MDSSHSYDDNNTRTITMPQHLINSTRTMEESHCNSKKCRKRRRPSSSLIAIPCFLLSTATPGNNTCHGYTTSKSPYTKTPTSNKSLLTKAREIREIKNTNGPDLLTATNDILPSSPNFDNNALSAALFDDDFTTSLENSILNLNSATKPNDITASVSNLSSKAKAEEFDRFMEEDSNVACLIYDETKPGGLVNGVKESRGSDVVDNMEVKLQKEAYNRRRMRRESLKNKLASRNNGEDAAPLSSTAKATRRKATKLHTKKKSSKSSLLTKEQEYALANTIQAGTKLHKLKAEYESKHTKPLSKKQWATLASMSPNDLRKLISDYRSAKQELVSSNMGLVHAVVKNYSSKANYRGVHLDELVQEGSLGLIRAAELFDPAKNLRFSTYATIWIKGVLSNSNSLDDMITLPSREKTLSNKVRTAWEEIDGGKGTKPNISASKEIAQKLQMKESVVKTHLQRMARASNILSLDYQYNVGSRSGTTNDRQESLHNIQLGTDADLAEQLQFKADIVSELTSNLSEKEVQLMRLRYGLCNDGKEHTVKECAAIMGVSRETARQLQHKCLKKLREASSMESLQEYLLTVA